MDQRGALLTGYTCSWGKLGFWRSPRLLQVGRGVGGQDRVDLHLCTCEIFPIGRVFHGLSIRRHREDNRKGNRKGNRRTYCMRHSKVGCSFLHFVKHALPSSITSPLLPGVALTLQPPFLILPPMIRSSLCLISLSNWLAPHDGISSKHRCP